MALQSQWAFTPRVDVARRPGGQMRVMLTRMSQFSSEPKRGQVAERLSFKMTMKSFQIELIFLVSFIEAIRLYRIYIAMLLCRPESESDNGDTQGG